MSLTDHRIGGTALVSRFSSKEVADYHSFLGTSADLQPAWTPEDYCRGVIAAYVRRELNGRLPLIQPEYRAE